MHYVSCQVFVQLNRVHLSSEAQTFTEAIAPCTASVSLSPRIPHSNLCADKSLDKSPDPQKHIENPIECQYIIHIIYIQLYY